MLSGWLLNDFDPTVLLTRKATTQAPSKAAQDDSDCINCAVLGLAKQFMIRNEAGGIKPNQFYDQLLMLHRVLPMLILRRGTCLATHNAVLKHMAEILQEAGIKSLIEHHDISSIGENLWKQDLVTLNKGIQRELYCAMDLIISHMMSADCQICKDQSLTQSVTSASVISMMSLVSCRCSS